MVAKGLAERGLPVGLARGVVLRKGDLARVAHRGARVVSVAQDEVVPAARAINHRAVLVDKNLVVVVPAAVAANLEHEDVAGVLLAFLDDLGVNVAYGLLVGVRVGVGGVGSIRVRVGIGSIRIRGVVSVRGGVGVRAFHGLLGRLELLPREAALHGGNLR